MSLSAVVARARPARAALVAALVLAGAGVLAPTAVAATALSTVKVNPTDVLGGDPATGTVTLNAAAPAGGFTVPLSSDNPTAATVPASVTVPAGATSASFPVTTFQVPNPQSALIIGTGGGVTTYAIITAWTPSTFNRGQHLDPPRRQRQRPGDVAAGRDRLHDRRRERLGDVHRV